MNNFRFLIPLLFLLSAVAGAASTPSSLALSSSINPSALGQSITLTATVSPGGATGKVTFYDGTIILATRAVAGGKAALTTTLLPFGSLSLKAHYEGDATYQPSNAPVLAQAVNAGVGFGFAPPVTYTSSLANFNPGVVIADFNGDGRADLVFVGSLVGDGVEVFLGNGDGTFQTGITTPGSPNIASAVSGDFNDDGRMDLLIVGDAISFLAGRGDGTFDPPVLVPNVAAGALAVGDFNGDGFADVAVVLAPSTLTVLLGNGDGTFGTSSFAIPSPGNIAVNDFNGDGKADLAIFGQLGAFSVFLGNGDGTFQAALSFPTVNSLPGSFVVGDFDRNGKLDAALSFGDGTIVILTGNGDGTFRQTGTYVSTNPGITQASNGPLTLGDFNGDRIPDIAFGNYVGVTLMLGKPDGTFELTSRSSQAAIFAIAGEFNNDGRTDLVTATGYNLFEFFVLLGNSTAGPPTPSRVSMTASPSPIFPGEPINMTAYVVAARSIGTVTFRDGSTPLGTATLTSKATAALTAPLVSSGLRSLYADFSGNVTDLPSTSVSAAQINVLPLIAPIVIPAGYPPPLTGNVLMNPGAESLLLGWSGTGFDVTSAAPHSGAESFYATRNASIFGSQTISLLAIPNVIASDIDSGILSANYSYWYKNRTSATGGRYQITLTFYDSKKTRIGQGRSVLRQGSLTWTNDSASIPIPPGTRSIVYTMNFLGTTDTGQFDDNALTVSRLFPTPNLLGDPGAESGVLANPWFPNLGASIVDGPTYFGSSGGAPHSGKYMFYGGPVAYTYISQTVDLSLVPKGFTGFLYAHYSFWFTDRAANPGSVGNVTLKFEDGNHVVLDTRVSNNAIGTAWVNVTDIIGIPSTMSTTRYIVYTMNFAGPSGTPATGVFDDTSLVIDIH